MRTNLVVDDALLSEARRLGGLSTKRAAVDEALRTYVRLKRQAEARSLRGTVDWIGDLDEMRRD